VSFFTIDEKQYEYGNLIVKIKSEFQSDIGVYNQSEQVDLNLNIPGFDNLENEIDIIEIKKTFSSLISSFPDLALTYTIIFSDTYSSKEFSEFLINSNMFEYSLNNLTGEFATGQPNDPLYSSPGTSCYSCPTSIYDQWYMSNIGATTAFNQYNYGGFKVNVAIIDDAVEIDHEDLLSNIWVNQGELPSSIISAGDTNLDGYISATELLVASGYSTLDDLLISSSTITDGIDNDNNGYIDDIIGWDCTGTDDNNPTPPFADFDLWSHGTHVTGIAGAETDNNLGMASLSRNNARIIPIKIQVDNATVTGFNFDDLMDAIIYAYINNAKIFQPLIQLALFLGPLS
jgi:subtilisin family serine protease